METTLLLILTIISIVILISIFIKKPNKNENNSQDFLLTLNENLRKEIQEIRREMTSSSELGRKEIENKLSDINKGIINFQNKDLSESKKSFTEGKKNLFYKIVLGDKSDNILPIFKKCGPKTCEKYYENQELFLEALKKESGAQEKYKLNKKLVDFNEIPENLVKNFLEEYKSIIDKL